MDYETTQLARTPLLLLNYAVQKGADRTALMNYAGLSPDDLADPDSRVKATASIKLWRAIIDGQNDPLLGLHIGRSIKAAELGLVGYAMYYSRDLGSALCRLALYQQIISESVIFEIQDGDEQAVLIWQADPLLAALGHPIEFIVTLIVTLAREITDSDLVPINVNLPSPRPENVAAYRSFFRCPISFDRPLGSVTLSRQQMALPAKATDVTLAGYLGDLADQTIRPLMAQDASMIATVRRTLWQLLPGGHPDLYRVALQLGISERSLQRHLEKEGSSFSRVLDDLRRDLSEELLMDRKLSVAQVAFLLGYSEPSAFQRAFRRWRGISPRRFRVG